MEESDLKYVIPDPGPSLAAPVPVVLFISNRLKTAFRLFCLECQISCVHTQIVIGWMVMHPLFHLLRVLQRLVFPEIFPPLQACCGNGFMA